MSLLQRSSSPTSAARFQLRTCRNQQLDLCDVLPNIVHSALSSALWPENERFRPYRFDVGFIDDGGFNAASIDACPGHGLVAFCAGMPLMLLGSVLQIARQMDSATALPMTDAAGRVIVTSERRHLIASANSRGTITARMSALLDGQQVDDVPPETLALAVFMYDMCARFIAMHECMHIGLGHTAYVRRELGIDVLQEFHRGGSRRLEPSFSQTLEFIADRHTVHGLLNHYLTCADSFGSRSTALSRAEIPESIFVMRTLIAALVTLMHLFPVRNRSLTQRTASHPHPYLRARWLCRELMTKLDKEQSLEGIEAPSATGSPALAATLSSRTTG